MKFVLLSVSLALTLGLSVARAQKQSPKKPTVPVSPWHSSTKRNEMDSIATTTLYVDSINSDAAVVVRCGGGKAEVYVNLADYVQPELGEGHAIRVKFDTGEPEAEYWYPSTDNRGLFSSDAPFLIRRLLNSKKFMFEFTPYEKQKKVLSFNVMGLERVLNPIFKSCGAIPATIEEGRINER